MTETELYLDGVRHVMVSFTVLPGCEYVEQHPPHCASVLSVAGHRESLKIVSVYAEGLRRMRVIEAHTVAVSPPVKMGDAVSLVCIAPAQPLQPPKDLQATHVATPSEYGLQAPTGRPAGGSYGRS